MIPRITLRKAINDPSLLGASLVGDSWHAWRTLLLAVMGEPLDAEELQTFSDLTGREASPEEIVEEFLGVIGRRGGKTRAMGVLAAYVATLCDHSAKLAAGERGVVLLIAPDQKQSKVLLQYVEGALRSSPVLSKLIENQTQDSITLINGIDIEVRAASFRRLRGLTCVMILADEASFWMSDEASANADAEILAAARPSLATTGGPLIIISSPYAKRGEVWSLYKRNFGQNGDPLVLVAQAASRIMNPSLPAKVVERALERDPAAAAAEYLAQFRNDVAGWADEGLIAAAVDHGVTVRPPQPGIDYQSFCDPSGGARDSFTAAIAHDEGGTAVLDCLVEIKAPFNPTSATRQIADTLKSYGVRFTIGDKYAANWTVDAFAKCGIDYRHSDRDRSAIYLDVLPLFTSGRTRLLDSSRLVRQFAALERRTSSAGKDRVDHGPNGHDDLCNAAAGALVNVLTTAKEPPAPFIYVPGRILNETGYAMRHDNVPHY